MKLFYVINGMGAGGAERSLLELLPHYRDAGVETTVVCLHRRDVGVQEEVARMGAQLHFLKGSFHAGWIRSLRRLIAAERPDLIHTTLFDSHMVGRLAAVGSGVPVISSFVGTPYAAVRADDRGITPWKFRIVHAIDAWSAKRLTTHFHAITYAVRDAYVDSFHIDPARVTVIERGRDIGRLGAPGAERKARVRAALGLAPDDEVLINVGRQEFPKGQGVLLQAIAELRKRRSKVVLLIAGREGNLSPELKRLHAELGLERHVRFLGFRSDVPDLLAASDLFVFPSISEGLGGAVIEAMGLGLPVVASDIPALREVVAVGRTADLVPVGSAEALAACLDQLLDSPERMAEYGRLGQERFAERFTIERSAHRMIAMYRRVAPVVTEKVGAFPELPAKESYV